MKQIFYIFLLIISLLTSCRKEEKIPNSTNVTPVPDFTITALDINYSVGSSWIYNVTTVQDEYVNIQSSNPTLSHSYTNTATYTVNVVRDSIISNTITAKILRYEMLGMDNINTYVRETIFYDPSDLKWHNILYQKNNGGAEVIGCFGIDLPLTASSRWKNTHASHLSNNIDSCYSIGFENAACGLGNIKCIKFKNNGAIDNTYWYNNLYGKVRVESSDFNIINQIAIVKNSTLTLSSFHN